MPDTLINGESLDPATIVTRSDFATALTALRERMGMTVRDVAKAAAFSQTIRPTRNNQTWWVGPGGVTHN